MRTLTLLAISTVLTATVAIAAPLNMLTQGRLLDASGVPLEDELPVEVFLYDTPAGGTALWSDAFTVDFNNGYYSLDLGNRVSNPFNEGDFDGALYYTFAVDGGPPMARTELMSVPFAIRARSADSLSSSATVDWSNLQNVPDVTDTLNDLNCSDGEVARWSTPFDEWYCDDDQVLSDADIIAVIESTPISLPAGTTLGGTDPYTDADVRDYMQNNSVSLNSATTIGAQTISTGVHYDDGDAQSFVEGNAVDLDAGTTIGSQAISTGAHYGNSDTQTFIEGNAVDLDAGTTINSQTISTGAHYGNSDAQTFIEGNAVDLDAGTTINSQTISTGAHSIYDGNSFATSNQTCAAGDVVVGIDSTGDVVCQDASTNQHVGPVYRWNVWSTYTENSSWVHSNNSEMFGGIAPSTWTDGSAHAGALSDDMDVIRGLFTRKGFGGKTANVHAETYLMWSSTTAKMAGALFRIRNTTSGNITWTPNFRYTCYASWGERASISVNGADTWNTGGTNCSANNSTSVALTIPPNGTSTVVFVSGSSSPSSPGTNIWVRHTTLSFINNSLVLPNGLEWVDDFDTASNWFDSN